VALRLSCERAEAWGDDIEAAELAVLDAIRGEAAARRLPSESLPPDPWPDASPGSRLHAGLQDWAAACPLPLVLFFDEIDALRGRSLISVLRQLRDGFTIHPQAFPASVVLCGLRDIRDYKAAAGGDPNRLGTASPFNVAVESLRIGDFTADEVAVLYQQHTADTGQEFTPEAIQLAFALTEGQPWLVNALAREVTQKIPIEPPDPVSADHIETAKERPEQAHPRRQPDLPRGDHAGARRGLRGPHHRRARPVPATGRAAGFPAADQQVRRVLDR
jgi:hypothetical protein